MRPSEFAAESIVITAEAIVFAALAYCFATSSSIESGQALGAVVLALAGVASRDTLRGPLSEVALSWLKYAQAKKPAQEPVVVRRPKL